MRRLDRVDLGQVAHDGLPVRTFVGAGPELAAGGAEVQAQRRARVGAHGLALDRPPRLGRQAAVLALPAGARVARHVHGGAALPYPKGLIWFYFTSLKLQKLKGKKVQFLK